MKKFLLLIIVFIVLCVFSFSLAGCKEDDKLYTDYSFVEVGVQPISTVGVWIASLEEFNKLDNGTLAYVYESYKGISKYADEKFSTNEYYAEHKVYIKYFNTNCSNIEYKVDEFYLSENKLYLKTSKMKNSADCDNIRSGKILFLEALQSTNTNYTMVGS